MFSALKNYFIALIVGISIGAASTGYIVYDFKDQQLETYKSNQETIAAAALLRETEKVIEKQAVIYELNATIEATNAKHVEEKAKLVAHYTKLVNDGLRLRDPGKQSRSCPASADSDPTSGNHEETGTELSKEFTEMLLSEAIRADAVVEQANRCADYVIELNRILNVQK